MQFDDTHSRGSCKDQIKIYYIYYCKQISPQNKNKKRIKLTVTENLKKCSG